MRQPRSPVRTTLGILMAIVLLGSTARPAQAQGLGRIQRPRIITGPSVVYSRGYSPAFRQSAGFSYQAGYAPPVVVPSYSYYPANGLSYSSAPSMPYGATVYGSTYPGYGFSSGTGYGFGYLGYGFGYPGYTFGFGNVGTTYPIGSMGYVNQTWPAQQLQGYSR